MYIMYFNTGHHGRTALSEWFTLYKYICNKKKNKNKNLIGTGTEGTFVSFVSYVILTHWGRVTHICVSKLTIIGSDNGLSPGRRHAIIWTNAGIMLIRPLGTNFSEILIEIITFSFKKMRLKVSSAKWRPFCLGLNALMCNPSLQVYYSPVIYVLYKKVTSNHI